MLIYILPFWWLYLLGIQVQMDLKGAEKTSGKKTGSGRGKRGASEVVEKGAGRGSGSAAKRKK